MIFDQFSRVVFERLFSAALLCLGPWTFQPTLPAAGMSIVWVLLIQIPYSPCLDTPDRSWQL